VDGGDPLELQQPAGERAEQRGLVRAAADAAGDLVDQRLLGELVATLGLLLVDPLRAPPAGGRRDLRTERVEALAARDQLQRRGGDPRRPLPHVGLNLGREVGDHRKLERHPVGHGRDQAARVGQQQPGEDLFGAGQRNLRAETTDTATPLWPVRTPSLFRHVFRRKVQNLTPQLV
jgi:hypothetical protein